MKYYLLGGTAVLGIASYIAAQRAMQNCQGRRSDPRQAENKQLTSAPEILKVSVPVMPYVEGEYKLSTVTKDGIGFNDMPVWISTFQDEGVNYCLYSDGDRWKVGEHSEKDMSTGKGWFKSSESHGGVLLPHELEGSGIGFLRPRVLDDEPENQLVFDRTITVTEPGTLMAVGSYEVGNRVEIVSSTLLSSIIEDMDVDIGASPSVVGGTKGLVTGYRRDQFAALITVLSDAGVTVHLPSIALKQL
eukprot:TRINITY_DN14846_c0_g1_i2.p1 TRINITY_DN14846_c0_g1~~TRINITY_DN14846_c0_g1_i2.p1  ORF type:complete len:246 (+),score=27.01 TRINITY_DN14846_c0_g1_i2:77-814(+)